VVRPDELVTQVVGALQEEIQEARKAQRSQWTDLTDGQYLGAARDRQAYRFALDDDLVAAEGSPARLKHGGSWRDCEVASIGSGVVVLNLAQALDGPLGSAVLQVDATYLLELQVQQWEAQLEPASGCNWSLVLRCLTLPDDTATAQPTPASVSPKAAAGLNAEQQQALQASATRLRTYLWGPPGTGKTTTVAALVQQLVESGLSVLLVSNTNTAVDTAVERLLPLVAGRDLVVRVGAAASESLAGRPVPVLLHEIIASRGDDLGRRREEAVHELRTARLGLRRQRGELSAVAAERSSFEDLKRRQAVAVAALPGLRNAVRQTEQLAAKLRSQLDQQERRAASGGARVSAAVRCDVQLCADDAAKAKAALQAGEREAAELTTQYTTLVSAQLATTLVRRERELEAGLAALQLDVARLQRLSEQLDAELDALKAQVINEAAVVCCTAYKACLDSTVRARPYDVVVVDEASMLPLALSLLVASLARRSVVFAGDFRQLPPIVQAETDRAKQWLRRDAFGAASIPAAVARGSAVPGLVALREQHRMREEIADLVSAFAYPEMPLKTAASVRARAVRPAQAPITVIDTSCLNPAAAFRGGSASRYNVLHAQVAAALLQDMSGDVGLIAPFRAQADLLRAVAPGRRASTVHRYQGGEADVVLLDTTLGRGAGSGGWFSAQEVHEEGVRLLNVAVSRAREQLVVVADVPSLRAAVAATGAVRRLLEMLLAGQVVPAETLVPVLDADEGASAFVDSVMSSGRAVVCSKRLGRGLVQGLVTAAHPELIIVSVPPADIPAADRGRHALRLAELDAAGVRVELRRPCLEDWAVVDDVIWTRPDGVLAPQERGGGWVRFEGRDATERLLALSSRRRAPWEGPPAPGRWTSACPSCGLPQARVERWDGRAWDECWRGTCIRSAPVTARVPQQPATDPREVRRDALRQVAVHNFLVDDK
jgi:hypothetical protein